MSTDLGTDISTPDGLDLDPMMRTVSGVRGLGQALARRLITPRGSLVDDASYGYDLRTRLNDSLTTADLAQLGAVVARECERDERVESASARVTLANGALRATITGTTSAGPFRLVIAVSDVTADVLAAEDLAA